MGDEAAVADAACGTSTGGAAEAPQADAAGLTRRLLVDQLRAQLQSCQQSYQASGSAASGIAAAEAPGRTASERGDAISTGSPALDALLPGGGLSRGTLVEWLGDSSATLLAVWAARQALAAWPGRYVAVIEHDPARDVPDATGGTTWQRPRLYPLAAAAWGLPLASTAWIRVATTSDLAWAIDQALRSPAIAAVLAWPRRVDDRTFRRWQLAAESTGAVGLFCRPTTAWREASWAEVRWAVQWESLEARGASAVQGVLAARERAWRLRVRCASHRYGAANQVVTLSAAPTGLAAGTSPTGSLSAAS
jgi:hypothetical protein